MEHTMRVSVDEFKADVDHYLMMVAVEKKEIILTRNGEAIARVTPIIDGE